MLKRRTIVLSTLTLMLFGSGGMPHAESHSSSVRLFEFKPFEGNPFGVLARAQPKNNPRAPGSIANIKPDADATRRAAGAMIKDGVVNDTRRDFGSFGIPYTTTRVQEGVRGADADDLNRLSTTYPYSAVGLLGSAEVGGFCSASVIRRGIVLTAAHCLEGEDTQSLIFWPGYYNGEGGSETTMAPYGAWNAFRASVPGSWTSSDGACVDSTENDVAILAMEKNEDGAFIGDLVGTLGYAWNNFSFVSSENTGNLAVAAVTTLGYPGFMDSGQVMQRADGPTYAVTASLPDLTGCGEGEQIKLLQQGTNFTGGSSGGPWVVNFSGRDAELGVVELDDGTTIEAEVGEAPGVAVIGVTSFGNPDPNLPKDNFSSQFGQNREFPDADYGGYGAGNIGALLQEICESEAPKGGTLASEGYCD